MRKLRVLIGIVLVLALVFTGIAAAQDDDTVCVFYFTGVGCPHCANVDPVILGDWLQEYPELVVIEYEVYKHPDNPAVFQYFVQQLNLSSRGVPNVVFGEGLSIAGDTPILNSVPQILEDRENISAEYGDVFVTLERLNIEGIPGSPQIWHQERVLIRNGTEEEDEAFIKLLLSADDLNDAVAGHSYEEVDPVPVPISGGEIVFEHAIAVTGWTLQWNGDALSPPETLPATTPAAPIPCYLGIVAFFIVASAVTMRKG